MIFNVLPNRINMSREEIKEKIEKIKELLREGDCRKALVGMNIMFRNMTVVQMLGYDLLEDIEEIVELWERCCE